MLNTQRATLASNHNHPLLNRRSTLIPHPRLSIRWRRSAPSAANSPEFPHLANRSSRPWAIRCNTMPSPPWINRMGTDTQYLSQSGLPWRATTLGRRRRSNDQFPTAKSKFRYPCRSYLLHECRRWSGRGAYLWWHAAKSNYGKSGAATITPASDLAHARRPEPRRCHTITPCFSPGGSPDSARWGKSKLVHGGDSAPPFQSLSVSPRSPVISCSRWRAVSTSGSWEGEEGCRP